MCLALTLNIYQKYMFNTYILIVRGCENLSNILSFNFSLFCLFMKLFILLIIPVRIKVWGKSKMLQSILPFNLQQEYLIFGNQMKLFFFQFNLKISCIFVPSDKQFLVHLLKDHKALSRFFFWIVNDATDTTVAIFRTLHFSWCFSLIIQ
jgi:hypothetical protein